MKNGTLDQAVAEARRFIKSVDQLRIAQALNDERFPSANPRETGAVRRASMDLTRKLADLRAGR